MYISILSNNTIRLETSILPVEWLHETGPTLLSFHADKDCVLRGSDQQFSVLSVFSWIDAGLWVFLGGDSWCISFIQGRRYLLIRALTEYAVTSSSIQCGLLNQMPAGYEYFRSSFSLLVSQVIFICIFNVDNRFQIAASDS